MSANLLPGSPMTREATPAVAARWRATLVACVAVFAALLAVFWSTVQGMVHIWYNFETYTHGFLILPISLWLVWRKRVHLAAFTPQAAPAFLILVGGGLLVWGLARLTGVLVAEQAAFVGIVISGIASLLGWQVARFLAFPLLFLFFAVPMGEDLVPPMMEFTATFTVEALKLSGIPVYREGLWFSLPSGNWSVVEACSGVRYLIASVTLGVMYAYITYHTLWKRLLFIAMSAVVPIIANGLRAYMIVMIGHLSEMKYATGVDHLIYGWVFFGVVMFILFWIGSFWQEHEPPPRSVPPPRALTNVAVGMRVAVIAGLVVAASASTLALVQQAEAVQIEMAGPLTAPAGSDGWERLSDPALWSPEHQPTPHTIAARYARGEREVQLFVVLFPQQRQGGEAINQGNRIAVDLVRRVGLGADVAEMGGEQVKVNRYRAIVADGVGTHEHLVWQWYRVAGHSLTNRYAGKAREALARIYPGRTDGAWIAVTTAVDSLDQQSVEKALAEFVQRMAPQIDAAIDTALGVQD